MLDIQILHTLFSFYMFEKSIKVWKFSFKFSLEMQFLTLLHSEWPKLHRVLAVLSAVGLSIAFPGLTLLHSEGQNSIEF